VLNLVHHRLKDRHVSALGSKHRQVVAFSVLQLQLGPNLGVPRLLGALLTLGNLVPAFVGLWDGTRDSSTVTGRDSARSLQS